MTDRPVRVRTTAGWQDLVIPGPGGAGGGAPALHAETHQDGGTDELALDGSQITTGTVADARVAATIARDSEVTAAVSAHEADTTAVHGIADTAQLVLTGDARLSDTRTPTDNSATNAKLADMVQATIKGRAAAAGTGDPTDLTAAQVKTLLAIASTDVSGLGSLATKSTITAAEITDGTVANAELANMVADTIKGRITSTGVPQDLTAAQVKTMLGIDNITVASTAPSSPAVNDLWVDTT
jgi:hypothetical protein